MTLPYPYSILYELGPIDPKLWPDYLSLATFDDSHIPTLIQLATHVEFITAMPDTQAYWTAVHAWRTLAQLRAEEAIEPLLKAFPLMDHVDNDRATSEIFSVLAQIGPASLTRIADFLADPRYGDWPRIHLTFTLSEMPVYYPASQQRCASIAAAQLTSFEQQDRIYNGYLVRVLLDLSAVQHIEVINQAYRADKVELSHHGDWQAVHIKLGLLKERLTPAPAHTWNFISTQDDLQQWRQIWANAEEGIDFWTHIDRETVQRRHISKLN